MEILRSQVAAGFKAGMLIWHALAAPFNEVRQLVALASVSKKTQGPHRHIA